MEENLEERSELLMSDIQDVIQQLLDENRELRAANKNLEQKMGMDLDNILSFDWSPSTLCTTPPQEGVSCQPLRLNGASTQPTLSVFADDEGAHYQLFCCSRHEDERNQMLGLYCHKGRVSDLEEGMKTVTELFKQLVISGHISLDYWTRVTT